MSPNNLTSIPNKRLSHWGIYHLIPISHHQFLLLISVKSSIIPISTFQTNMGPRPYLLPSSQRISPIFLFETQDSRLKPIYNNYQVNFIKMGCSIFLQINKINGNFCYIHEYNIIAENLKVMKLGIKWYSEI